MAVARRVALMFAVLWALTPGGAEAGRRPFIWAYDTELVPEGTVELEQWLWARSPAPTSVTPYTGYWVWWSPVIGLSSYLELQFPFQLLATEDKTQLESFELDLRYRLLGRESQSPFQPLLRLTYHQGIGGSRSRVDANLVASYDFTDALHGVVDLGGRLAVPALTADVGDPTLQGTYDVGLSYRLGESDFKLSAELFGEVSLVNLTAGVHQFVGASVAWTRGRVWLTAGALVGLTPLFPETPYVMPRLICGVVL